MRKFILTTLAAASLLSCGAVSTALAAQRRVAPQDTPIGLLNEIYGQYPDSAPAGAWRKADKEWLGAGDVGKLPRWETLPLSHDTAALNRRVDKAIGNSGEVCIDFDQLSDSQDPNIAQYRIVGPSAPKAGKAQYDVYLKGAWRKDVARVTYLLVQEQGKWRVDDIVTYATDKKGGVVKSGARDMLGNCLKN